MSPDLRPASSIGAGESAQWGAVVRYCSEMRQISGRQSIDEARRGLIKSVGLLPLAAGAPAWGVPLPSDDGPDPRGATVTPRVRILTRWYRTGMIWRPVNALIVSGGSTRLLADPMPSEAIVRALIEFARPAPALLLVAPDRPGAREAIACATMLGVPARVAVAPEEIDLGGALVWVREMLELDVDVDATRLSFGARAGGATGWFVPFSGQPQWLGPSASSI